MASEVTLVFSGDSRGAVSAAKAVESSLGSLKGATGEVGAETERTSSGVRQHWGAISLAAGGALAAIVAGGKRAGDAASGFGGDVEGDGGARRRHGELQQRLARRDARRSAGRNRRRDGAAAPLRRLPEPGPDRARGALLGARRGRREQAQGAP